MWLIRDHQASSSSVPDGDETDPAMHSDNSTRLRKEIAKGKRKAIDPEPDTLKERVRENDRPGKDTSDMDKVDEGKPKKHRYKLYDYYLILSCANLHSCRFPLKKGINFRDDRYLFSSFTMLLFFD